MKTKKEINHLVIKKNIRKCWEKFFNSLFNILYTILKYIYYEQTNLKNKKSLIFRKNFVIINVLNTLLYYISNKKSIKIRKRINFKFIFLIMYYNIFIFYIIKNINILIL